MTNAQQHLANAQQAMSRGQALLAAMQQQGGLDRQYKTRLCRDFSETGRCPRGRSCTFAHGEAQLRGGSSGPHHHQAAPPSSASSSGGASFPVSYKAKMCRNWQSNGSCPFGHRCHYAHGHEELVEHQAATRAPQRHHRDPPVPIPPPPPRQHHHHHHQQQQQIPAANRAPPPPPATSAPSANMFELLDAEAQQQQQQQQPHHKYRPELQPRPHAAAAAPTTSLSSPANHLPEHDHQPVEEQLSGMRPELEALVDGMAERIAMAYDLLKDEKYEEGIRHLEAFDWAQAKTELADTECAATGVLDGMMTMATQLVTNMYAKHAEQQQQQQQGAATQGLGANSDQTPVFLVQSVQNGEADRVWQLVDALKRSGTLDTASLLPSLVWVAAAELANIGVLQALLSAWNQDSAGYCWTHLQMPPDGDLPQRHILHEAVKKGSVPVAKAVVAQRRRALVEICPPEGGVTALFLALQLRMPAEMIDALSPDDYLPAFETLCGGMTARQYLDVMLGSPLSNDDRNYLSAALFNLDQKYCIAMDKMTAASGEPAASGGPSSGSLPAESAHQNHKGPKGKGQAAETRAEAWAREMREAAAAEEARKAQEKVAEATMKRVQALEQLASDLRKAVDNGDFEACKATCAKLGAEGAEAYKEGVNHMAVGPKEQLQLVWRAAVDVGSLPILLLLADFFSIAWETRNFGNPKAPRTILAHALHHQKFEVAEEAMGILSDAAAERRDTKEGKRLQEHVLKVLEDENGSPLTTAVMGGASLGLVELLLVAYVKIKRSCEERDRQGNTPLSAAVQCGSMAVLERVIDRTDLTKRGNGAMPLWLAVQGGDLGKVQLVMAAAKASFGRDPERWRRFLEHREARGGTALWQAAFQGHTEIAAKLVEAGASALSKGKDGSTPLIRCVAICPGDKPSPLLKSMVATLDGDKLSGAMDSEGNTVLHAAVAMDGWRIAKYLLGQGADVMAVNQATVSPFVMTLQAAEKGVAGAGQLLSAVLKVWSQKHVVGAVVPNMPEEDRERAEAYLLNNHEKLIQPFTADKKQFINIAQDAVNCNNWQLLRLLMKKPNFPASKLLLHGLVPSNSDDSDQELVLALLDAGADIDARDQSTRETILHLAVLQANEGLVQALLDRDAQTRLGDQYGDTPLHLAVQCIQPIDLRERLCEMIAKKDYSVLEVENRARNRPSQCTTHKSTKKLLQGLERIGKGKARIMAMAASGDQGDGGEGSGQRSAAPVETLEEVVVRTQAEAEGSGMLYPVDETPEQRRLRVSMLIQKLSAADLQRTKDPKPVLEQSIQSALSQVFPSGQQPSELPLVDEGGTLVGGEGPEAEELLQDPEDGPDGVENVERLQQESLEALTGDCPWEFVITREARQEWSQMDEPFRSHVLQRLVRIASGFWVQDGNTVRLTPEDKSLKGLELWRTKFHKSGRIVFEVAVDYSQRSKTWQETLRLWVITLNHDKYEGRIKSIEASYRRSKDVNQRQRLEADDPAEDALQPQQEPRGAPSKQRLPRRYHEIGEGGKVAVEGEEDEEEQKEKHQREKLHKDVRDHMPPASSQQDSYTLLKFYSVSQELLKTVLSGLDDSVVDFPFRVSPTEQDIIEMNPVPPCSILLLGRSGTGKTTCAVYRIWGHWMTHHMMDSDTPFHQVFLTASATLKEQVGRAFRKLQAAALVGHEELLLRYEEASFEEYATLSQVPDDAFPLFLTTKVFLQMLDGTLSSPFFPRRDNGTLLGAVDDLDPDGMGIEIDLGYGDEDDPFADNDFNDVASSIGGLGYNQGPQGQGEQQQAARAKQEVTYQFFVGTLWNKITTKEERSAMKASLVYQEIMSYLKGSCEAMRSEGGCLSVESYLMVGKKRAPNFSDEERQAVYPIFQRYQRAKAQMFRYDNMDLVGHIYRSVVDEGYKGTPIHSLYRDEVQDFTQAELLLDMRCVADPNSLLYCGDTCQTIARGIGFRFTDIQTLMYDEAQERKRLVDAGQADQSAKIGVPIIQHLKVNYRTHSGIIDVASSVVDLIKNYFPRHIDNLERERAFFKGPSPLLLSSLSMDDISILLSGSDRSTSQVEFGAHQVILVRQNTSRDQLPQELRESSAIIMTVSQSKGLEFDDVFLVDFFHDSPADIEWRLLITYLQQIESQEGGEARLPSGNFLQQVDPDPSTPQGAVRPLEFNDRKHVLLCEELKHLYTAITRAKNNVVIFDQNSEKRAPFYHYLRRCGLARDVRTSLLEDGADASKFGLKKASSSAEEWLKRAANLFDNKLFDLASKSYSTAGDPVRALMAKGMAGRQQAEMASETGSARAADIKGDFYVAGADLVTAVQQASKAPTPVPARDLQRWLKVAVQSFIRAGAIRTAAEIVDRLGMWEKSLLLYSRLGDRADAARCAEEAATKAEAEGNTEAAARLWGEAFRQRHLNNEHLECLEMARNRPEVRELFPNEVARSLEAGLQQLLSSGKREEALSLSRELHQGRHSDHERWLRHNGFWEELAMTASDALEAAELLARLGYYRAAAARVQQALTTNTHNLMTDRLHGYLLMNGTKGSLRAAVDLWANRTCREQSSALLALASYRLNEARELSALPSFPTFGSDTDGSALLPGTPSEAASPPGSPTTSSPAAKDAERYASQAHRDFEASGDPIGTFYAFAVLAQARSLTVSAHEDADADMPGCSILLEQVQEAARGVLPLVHALQGNVRLNVRRDNKGNRDQEALKAAEQFFQVPKLTSTKAARAPVQYRRDNATMARAVARLHREVPSESQQQQQKGGSGRASLAAVVAAGGPEAAAVDAAVAVPSEPPSMTVELEAGLAKRAIAADMVFTACCAVLELADESVERAKAHLNEVDSRHLYSLPIDSAKLTDAHDRQLNALLQAFNATFVANSLASALPRSGREVEAPPRRHQGGSRNLQQAAVAARTEVLQLLLRDAVFPKFLMESDGDRVVSLIPYVRDSFKLHSKMLLVKKHFCKAVLDAWLSKSVRERVLNPNLAVFAWRMSSQSYLEDSSTTNFSGRNKLMSSLRGSRSSELAAWAREWPLQDGRGANNNALLLWTASSQLLVNKIPHEGVERVLLFLERCHVRGVEKQVQPALEPEHYLELLEVAASVLLPAIHGQGSEATLPVLLPRAYADTLYGLGLSSSPTQVKAAPALTALPRPALEALLLRLTQVAAHPHLSPMRSSPSSSPGDTQNTAEDSSSSSSSGPMRAYMRARGSLLLAILACNVTVALKQDVGGGAGMSAASLQEVLEKLQRRLQGIVEEERSSQSDKEDSALAEAVSRLLEAQRVGQLSGALLHLATSLGTALLEVTPSVTRELAGAWAPPAASSSKHQGAGKGGSGKGGKDSKGRLAARLSHLASLPAAWAKHDALSKVPLVASLPPQSLWSLEAAAGSKGGGTSGSGISGSSAADDANAKTEAAILILAAYRRYRRAKQLEALSSRLRQIPRFREAVKAFRSRLEALRQAQQTAELEAEVEHRRRAALSTGRAQERFSWVPGVLELLRTRAAAPADLDRLCPVCCSSSASRRGDDSHEENGEGGASGSHHHSSEEAAAHSFAAASFASFHEIYLSKACGALEASVGLLPLLGEAQAAALRVQDAAGGRRCLAAAEALEAAETVLARELEALEASRAWGYGAPGVAEAAEGLRAACQQARAAAEGLLPTAALASSAYSGSLDAAAGAPPAAGASSESPHSSSSSGSPSLGPSGSMTASASRSGAADFNNAASMMDDDEMSGVPDTWDDIDLGGMFADEDEWTTVKSKKGRGRGGGGGGGGGRKQGRDRQGTAAGGVGAQRDAANRRRRNNQRQQQGGNMNNNNNNGRRVNNGGRV